jgi:hypothetical protein
MGDGKVDSPNRGWDAYHETYTSTHGKHARQTGHVPVLLRPGIEVNPCTPHVLAAIPSWCWRIRAARRDGPDDVARPARPARRRSLESR